VNPYLAIAATLAGGAHGIENRLELPVSFDGDAYADPTLEMLPGSLEEAVDILEHSELARELLGEDFVVHYVASRRAEIAQCLKAPSWSKRHLLCKVQIADRDLCLKFGVRKSAMHYASSRRLIIENMLPNYR